MANSLSGESETAQEVLMTLVPDRRERAALIRRLTESITMAERTAPNA